MAGTSRGQLYATFGAYVRSQRQLAQLTLRQAAELASISNPYLSQIEHGLALPSIAVIGALADALSVSAETLLLQAAGIESPGTAQESGRTEDAIRQDARLDTTQKHALLAVLTSFLGSSSLPAQPAPAKPTKPAPAKPARARTRQPSKSGRPAAAGAANPRRRKT